MNLELEKKKLDIKKMETALHEYEYKILERMADIERIKRNIETQQKAINKAIDELAQLEG
jgi:hypothetical protein